jgi:hypothetical protein
VELSLRTLFLEPTVAGLAREVERLRAERADLPAPSITALPRSAGRVVRDGTDAPVPRARRSS